ncbi:hypothetical protein HMPREF9621_02892, partial [Cutibacterium modestum HL037PA2]
MWNRFSKTGCGARVRWGDEDIQASGGMWLDDVQDHRFGFEG